MTQNILDTLEVKQFEREVHHIFQEKGNMLRPTTRFRSLNGANKTQFPVLGRLQANERVVGTDIVTQNQTANAVELTLSKFTIGQFTDLFLSSEINFDARQEAAESVAMGLGRKLDQIIIDALDASATTKTVANNISGSVDDLTVAAFRDAARQMDIDGVPDSERTALIHPNGLHHLLEATETTSSDFLNVKALVNGDLGTFYGFNIVKIGNNGDEDGLPVDGSLDRTNYFYHKKSIGAAVNIDMRISIDWVPLKGSHLVSGFLSAGSVSIDDTGIVKVTTRES